MIDQYFGEEKENDWRFKYQFESKYYGYQYRPLKYYKQSESSSFGPVNNQTIPMIRMSEIYYIAAECLADANDPEKLKAAKSSEICQARQRYKKARLRRYHNQRTVYDSSVQ